MKVMVAVWNPSGSQRTVLTYEAPDDSQLGDYGKVELFVRDEHRNIVFDGTIVALESKYTDRCKPFQRLGRAGSQSANSALVAANISAEADRQREIVEGPTRSPTQPRLL